MEWSEWNKDEALGLEDDEDEERVVEKVGDRFLDGFAWPCVSRAVRDVGEDREAQEERAHQQHDSAGRQAADDSAALRLALDRDHGADERDAQARLSGREPRLEPRAGLLRPGERGVRDACVVFETC